MKATWTTTRRIVCLNDEDERVLVFRQHNPDLTGRGERRYVLGNGALVRVVEDSRFCIVDTRTVLRPMNV